MTAVPELLEVVGSYPQPARYWPVNVNRPVSARRCWRSVWHGRAVEAGYRSFYTTAADLAARCHRAALEGNWEQVMRFYANPRLLVVDEVGYLPLAQEAAAALSQVVSRRYLRGSVCLTTNLAVGQWARAFGEDTSVAGAMLDRLLHRSVVLNIAGDSYRMRAYRARAERLRGGRSDETRR